MNVISHHPQVLIRTARKDHRCYCNQHNREDRVEWHWCEEVIHAGSKHPEYVGESPAYQSGHRYCPPCAKWQLGDWVEYVSTVSDGRATAG